MWTKNEILEDMRQRMSARTSDSMYAQHYLTVLAEVVMEVTAERLVEMQNAVVDLQKPTPER